LASPITNKIVVVEMASHPYNLTELRYKEQTQSYEMHYWINIIILKYCLA